MCWQFSFWLWTERKSAYNKNRRLTTFFTIWKETKSRSLSTYKSQILFLNLVLLYQIWIIVTHFNTILSELGYSQLWHHINIYIIIYIYSIYIYYTCTFILCINVLAHLIFYYFFTIWVCEVTATIYIYIYIHICVCFYDVIVENSPVQLIFIQQQQRCYDAFVYMMSQCQQRCQQQQRC